MPVFDADKVQFDTTPATAGTIYDVSQVRFDDEAVGMAPPASEPGFMEAYNIMPGDGVLTKAMKTVGRMAVGIPKSAYEMGVEIVTDPGKVYSDVMAAERAGRRRIPDQFKQMSAGIWHALNESPEYDPNTVDASGQNPTAGFYNRDGVEPSDASKAAASQGMDWSKQATADLTADRQADPRSTKIGKLVESSNESIIQQAPGMLLSLAGQPQLGLPVMFGQTFGQKYAEDRAKGLSVEDATSDSLLQAGVEVTTEMLPFLQFAKFMKPGVFADASLRKQIAKMLVSEVPGEHLATALQNSSDVYFGETDPAKRMAAVQKYIESNKFTDDQIDTFWTTLLQTGTMSAMGKAAHVAQNRLSKDPLVQMTPQQQAEYEDYQGKVSDAQAYQKHYASQIEAGQMRPAELPAAPAWLEALQNQRTVSGDAITGGMEFTPESAQAAALRSTLPKQGRQVTDPDYPPTSFQDEAYDDTEDMPAPKGTLVKAASQAIPTAAAPVDDIPAFETPAAPVVAEPVREVTEADQVDFENAVRWEANLNRQGRPAIPIIEGEPEKERAWRLLSEYRKVVTPMVARDDSGSLSPVATAQTQEPTEYDKAIEWRNSVVNQGNGHLLNGLNKASYPDYIVSEYRKAQERTNGVTNTVSGMQGPANVDGMGVSVPEVQEGVVGSGSDNTQPGGQVNGSVQPVSQEGSEGQTQVPDLWQENVTPLDAAAHEAATSPANDIPVPSQAQIEAGNYKKGHVNLHGLDISIENPAGSERKGVDETGKAWSTKLKHHYGYIKGSIGKDKDHIDVFIKPGIDQTTAGDKIFVVDQKVPDTDSGRGAFDEHKVFIGFDSHQEANEAYQANYDSTGSTRMLGISGPSVATFNDWLKNGNHNKPFAGTPWATKREYRAPAVEEQDIATPAPAAETQPEVKSESQVPAEDAKKTANAIAFAKTQRKALEKKVKEAKTPAAKKKAQDKLDEVNKRLEDLQPIKVKTVRAAKPIAPLNPQKDHLLTAIAKLGGLDLANAVSLWGNMAKDAHQDAKINKRGVGGLVLFRKDGGLTVDAMAELLAEHGYLQRDENGKHDLVDFEDKLSNAIAGKTVVSDSNHSEVKLEVPQFDDEDIERLSLDETLVERMSADIADFFDSLNEDSYDIIEKHWSDAEAEAAAVKAEVIYGAVDGRNNEETVGDSPEGSTPEIRAGDGVVDKERQSTTPASETGEGTDSKPVTPSGKLFATPPAFGHKPQPKTTQGDVSTSDLLDNFTSVESVQPDLLGTAKQTVVTPQERADKHQAAIDSETDPYGIEWNNASGAKRDIVLRAAGWETKSGGLNDTGRRLAEKEWYQLEPNTQAIIRRHAKGWDAWLAEQQPETIEPEVSPRLKQLVDIKASLDSLTNRQEAATLDKLISSDVYDVLKPYDSHLAYKLMKKAEDGIPAVLQINSGSKSNKDIIYQAQAKDFRTALDEAINLIEKKDAENARLEEVNKPDTTTKDKPEEKKPEAKTPTKPKTKQVEDAGEELIYNKRNRLKGVKWDDIKDSTGAFKAEHVQKKKVYPQPDYTALVADGMPDVIAHIVKQVYDSISVAPITRNTPTDADFQTYISAVNRVMDGVMQWAQDNNAIAAWASKNSKGMGYGSTVSLSELSAKVIQPYDIAYPGGWRNFKDELHMIGGNKVLSRLQPGYDSVSRAIKDTAKGWPGKIASWQRQGYSISDNSVLNVKEWPGREADRRFSVMLGTSCSIDSFETQVAAQEYIAGFKPFLLIKKRYKVVDSFNTQEEAESAAKKLTTKEQKEAPEERGVNVVSAERIGPVRRLEGENVTSQQIIDAFGYRGINIGNWVPADEAQMHLNFIYDSSYDLADLLNLPLQAISLNGTIGIAVGAQGGGKWAAHYVPAYKEVNITRTKGAGAFIHELLGHGLDNYFGEIGNWSTDKKPYLSKHITNNTGGTVRPEVVDAFRTIINTMNKRKETPQETADRIKSAAEKAEKVFDKYLAKFEAYFEGISDEGKTEATRLFERLKSKDFGDGYVAISSSKMVFPVVADLYQLSRKYKVAPKYSSKIAVDDFQWLHQAAFSAKRSAEIQDQEHTPLTVDTSFMRASREADGKKPVDKLYWSTSWEMFARAVDAYITDKITERGQKNTYLSGLEAVSPQGEERKAINAAFDALFSILKTKETDKGVALFALAPDSPLSLLEDSPKGRAAAHIHAVTSTLEKQGYGIVARYEQDKHLSGVHKVQFVVSWKGMDLLVANRHFSSSGIVLRSAAGMQGIVVKGNQRQTSYGAYGDYMRAEMESLARIGLPITVDLVGEGSHKWFAANIDGAEKVKRGNKLIIEIVGKKQQIVVESNRDHSAALSDAAANKDSWDKTSALYVGDTAIDLDEEDKTYETYIRAERYTSGDAFTERYGFRELSLPGRTARISQAEVRKSLENLSGSLQDGSASLSELSENEIDDALRNFKLSTRTTGIQADEAQAWVTTLPIKKHVNVVQSIADLPADARNEITLAKITPSRVQAMELHGTIHVITDNVPDMQRVKALVIGHELAHAGQSDKIVDLAVDWFRRTEGKDTDQARNAHAVLQRMADGYGFDLNDEKQYRRAVMEATAAIAEQAVEKGWKPIGLMQRLFMYVKHWLRKTGLFSHVSDSELSLAVAEMLRLGEKRLSVGRGGDVAQFAAAWHGSPHDHDGFSTDKIGTGEGAQVYGWGLYFASSRGVAEYYKDTLSGHTQTGQSTDQYKVDGVLTNLGEYESRSPYYEAANGTLDNYMSTWEKWPGQHPGNQAAADLAKRNLAKAKTLQGKVVEIVKKQGKLYQVELAPKEDEYLLWDKPLSEQSEKIKEAIQAAFDDATNQETDYHKASAMANEYVGYAQSNDVDGKQAYNLISKIIGSETSMEDRQKAASEYLHSLGIRGIKYLDGTSRNRPLKDIKKAFLAELPEDSEFDDVMELISTGRFSVEQEALLKALDADDWLGFDYPAQAISAALGNNLNGFDPSQELRDAVADLSKDQQFNYVIFNDTDVEIKAKFALRDDVKQATENLSEESVLDNLKSYLPWADYRRMQNKLKYAPKDIKDGIAALIGNDTISDFAHDNIVLPLFVAEEHKDFAPVYETAKEREVNMIENVVRMMGGLFDKEGNPTPWDKVKNFLLDWDGSGKETGWSKLLRETALTKDERAMYTELVFEADAMGAEYSSLGYALRNPRIKALGVTQRVFDFYKKSMDMQEQARKVHIQIIVELMHKAGAPLEKIAAALVRNHASTEDIDENTLKSELTEFMKQMEADGKSINTVAKHVADYRGLVLKRKGRVHRDHGEGKRVVDVYHHVKALDFSLRSVTHKGVESDQLVLEGWNHPGNDVTARIKAIVDEMGGSFKQKKDDGTLIVLVLRGDGDNFRKQVAEIPLLNKAGEALHQVLVYRRFVNSRGEARKLSRMVERDLKKAMPIHYRDGETYTTKTDVKAQISEQMYQDASGVMATEQILNASVNSALARGEIDQDEAKAMKEAFMQDLAETFMARGAGAYQIRRFNHLIEGYDRTDALGKFEGYVYGTSGMLSKALYSFDQLKNLKGVDAERKEYAYIYTKDTLRNMGTGDKLSGNARAMASLWYLGANFSWMLVNSTQPYVLGQAELSKYTTSPVIKIAAAEKDICTGKLTEEEKALFDDMAVRQQDHDSIMAEMTGSGEGDTGKFSKWLHKGVRTTMAVGQKVEVLNRHTMILSAYRVFKNEKQQDHATALKNALQVNSMVNTDQGRHNLPEWARSALGRTFYALGSYGMHMLNYLYKRSTSGNRADQKAVLRLLFAMFLLGGLPAGAPGSDELDKLIQMFFGYSPKMALRSFTRKFAKDYDTPGELVDAFLWRGIPGAGGPVGVGVSLTQSIRMRIPFVTAMVSGSDMAGAVAGPVGGLVKKSWMATKAANRHDYYRMFEYLAPTAVANPMSGWRQYSDGVETASGKRVDYKGKQLKMTGPEALLRGVGVQPARIADISETRGYQKELKAEWSERRREAMERYRMTRDMKHIQKFNREYRDTPQAHGLVNKIQMGDWAKNKVNKKQSEWQQEWGN